MRCSNTFLASANGLSEDSGNPGRVLEAMRHTVMQTMKLQHVCYVADLLGDLLQRRTPLPSVCNLCSRLCAKLPERRVVTGMKMVMKWKLKDSWDVV